MKPKQNNDRAGNVNEAIVAETTMAEARNNYYGLWQSLWYSLFLGN